MGNEVPFAQLFCPERNKSAVGGPGDRILSDAVLGREETGYKIHLVSLGSHNNASLINLLQFGHVRFHIDNFLLAGKDQEVVFRAVNLQRFPSQSLQKDFGCFSGFGRLRREIHGQEVLLF